MRIFIILFLLLLEVNGANIVSQRVYEKDNRVDIMLTFDSEYNGKISQKRDKSGINLILQDAFLKKGISKKIVSPLVQNMEILPFAGGVILKLKGDESFKVQASKTIDNYGLRLRITPSTKTNNKEILDENLIVNEDEDISIQTKKESDIATAYLKVIFVLALLAIAMYWLKRWIERRGAIDGSWLFQRGASLPKKADQKSSIKLLQQRVLDHKNRVVLISFKNKEYLLLLGESNILLDSFDSTKQDSLFQSHLNENEEALKEFITNHNDDKLTNYKQKASFGG